MNPDNRKYTGLSEAILDLIAKEYPTTSVSQIEEILDETRDWAKELVVSWSLAR